MNYELFSNLIWPESKGHHHEKCIRKWRVVDWSNLMAFFQTWICNLKSICIFKWYWLWQCIYWASDPKDYFIYPANNVKIFPSIFGSFWTKKLDRKKSEIIWLYFDFVIENIEYLQHAIIRIQNSINFHFFGFRFWKKNVIWFFVV